MENQESKASSGKNKAAADSPHCFNRFILWAFAENALTISAFTVTAIFAPGGWKILAPLLLLNLNYWKNGKDKKQNEKPIT